MRWAIHDAVKFENLISRLDKYVDGLEKLTDSLGRLERRLREEIDGISDVQSLILLRDASSNHRSSSQYDVSDTVSRRLTIVTESNLEVGTIATGYVVQGTKTSFITARSRPSTLLDSISDSNLPIPGAWPRSTISGITGTLNQTSRQYHSLQVIFRSEPSCLGCLEENYECVPHPESWSCTRCVTKAKSCIFERGPLEKPQDKNRAALEISKDDMRPATTLHKGSSLPQDIPQNQRLMSDLLQKAKPRCLSFKAGDDHYGESLETFKKADIGYLLQNSAKLAHQANRSSSAAKRMFFELRNIRTGNIPFISAVPVGDSLDRVLASIEGPPETPYEGGVFWKTVKISDRNPNKPPLMKFHTKIYHPNISPQGHICADYNEKWNYVLSASSCNTIMNPAEVWYRGKSTQAHWSLGALLTALCGLLASPDVDDPLVPEIAREYLADHDSYCEAARLYTKRYAVKERPDEDSLTFLADATEENLVDTSAESIPLRSTAETEVDLKSIEKYWRGYDEKPLSALSEAIPRPYVSPESVRGPLPEPTPEPIPAPGRELRPREEISDNWRDIGPRKEG